MLEAKKGQISPLQSGNIVKCIITGNTGKSIDITAGVVDVSYYESILSNTVTATLTIVDTGAVKPGSNKQIESPGGILDLLPVRGGERVDLEIEDATPESDSGSSTIKVELYVNRVRNASPDSLKNIYFLDLCSAESLSNELSRVVKRYQGKISTNVSSIVKDVLKSKKTVNIDPTALDYNFYGNSRKPFYVCTWLASKAVPDVSVGNAAGYLFYQDRDSFNFRSVDKLLEQSASKRMIYTGTVGLKDGYDAPIYDYDIERDIDLHQNLSLGTYRNRSTYYDPFSFNYNVIDYGSNQQKGKVKTAGRFYSADLVNKNFTAGPSRLMTSVMDIGYNPPGDTPEEQLKYVKDNPGQSNFDANRSTVQSIMRYNQLFTIITNITIPGMFEIRAGQMIYCAFPEQKAGGTDEINKKTEGKYLVAHVCHKLTADNTVTSLGLVRDSYGKE